MRGLKSFIIVVFFIMMLFGCSTANNNLIYDEEEVNNFSISFHNDTNMIACYFLYWVDHDFDNHPYPANMAGGELAPGQTNVLENKYPCGHWVIRWSGCRSDDFEVVRELMIDDSVREVLSTPLGDQY